MNTAWKDCIWYEQCESECCGKCDDYSPVDDSELNEAFYQSILRENAEEYQDIICEYTT